jgi:hypothetical protein
MRMLYTLVCPWVSGIAVYSCIDIDVYRRWPFKYFFSRGQIDVLDEEEEVEGFEEGAGSCVTS